MTNAQIAQMLSDNGFQSTEINGTEGGHILALNAGARVLRLTSESGRDFFWLNDAFIDGDSSELFGQTGWRNFGGDRTWISPETDLFIGDLSDPWGTYQMPESFDPGSYSIQAKDGEVCIFGSFEVINHRLRNNAKLHLKKTIAAEPNPLGTTLDSVEYAGFSQSTTLSLASECPAGLRFGMWHLSQVRATGEMLIPIIDSDRPRDYLAPSDTDHLSVKQGLARFRIDAAEQHKIGVKASKLTGRAAYMSDSDGGACRLIVRDFHIDPQALYIDVPWDNLEDFGYALQCYNDDGKLAHFGELEYHTPAIGDGTGLSSYTDISRLWAFAGEKSSIREIATKLLGTEI